MPTFLGSVAANVFLAFGASAGTALAVAGFVADYGLILGGLAFSSNQAKRAKRRARAEFNAQQVDRLANVNSTVGPRELVLGRVRKGGNVFFRGSTGPNKTTFVMLIALAAHEIDAVEGIYLNDQLVTLDGSGNVTDAPYALASTMTGTAQANGSGVVTLEHTPIAGSVVAYSGTQGGPDGDVESVAAAVSGLTVTTTPGANVAYQYTSYAYHVNVRTVTGTDTQAADAATMARFPTQWTAAHRARGVAYLVVTCQYSETAFPSGLPTVTAVLRGAKVYDPRENRLLRSRAFGNATWSKTNCTVTATNTVANFDGSLTADHITSTGDGYVSQSVAADASTTYTFSVWLAAPSPMSIALIARSVQGAYVSYADTVSNINVTTSMQRFSVTLTTRSIDTSIDVFIGGYGTFSSGEQIYIGDAQLVQGTRPKANTVTTTAAVVPVTAWSANPALQMRHVYQHAWFGKATITADEDDRIITAANACDTSTTYTVGTATETRALYESALVVPFGTAAKDVLDDLAQSMGGSWAFAGGELYLKAGVWTEPVMALTDADLAVVQRSGEQQTSSPIAISTHRPRVDKVNTVNVQIWDAAQAYKQVTLSPLTSSALVTADGATLAQSVTYAAIGYAPQALHVAGIMMRDARDPLTVTIPFKQRAYPLELFDNVTLTLARYGWSAKAFQVLGRTWSADGQLQLTLKETASSITTMDAAFQAQGGAANTTLPSPWFVPQIGPLTISSGTSELVRQADGTVKSRMRVSWPAVPDSAVTDGGSVEVQYREAISTGEWTSVQIAGNETQAVITDVQDAVYYLVRARARARLAVGDWSAHVSHQVLGKTEPPPDVDSLAINGQVLSWPPVSAIDLAGYRVRAIAGSTVNWAGGFALHEGVITAPPYTMPGNLGGLYTYMVVAVDTSGNESTVPATVTATSTYSLAGNTLESWPQAPLFEGTIVNGSIVAGQLVADSTGTLFWAGDANLHFAGDAALYWGATSYAQMTYTCAIGPSAPGLLVLDSWISGDVVSIDMRRGSSGPFWSSDAATFWTSDPATFWSALTSAWTPWPGALDVVAGEYIELRVITSAGPTQGVIATFTPYLDVPTVEDYIDNAVVSASGSRLTLAQTFRAIKNIQLTVQQDGGAAVTARWVDKLATGPLVQALDISGNPVPATVDAYLKGY